MKSVLVKCVYPSILQGAKPCGMTKFPGAFLATTLDWRAPIGATLFEHEDDL